jgi:cysteine-rich repeat protein
MDCDPSNARRVVLAKDLLGRLRAICTVALPVLALLSTACGPSTNTGGSNSTSDGATNDGTLTGQASTGAGSSVCNDGNTNSSDGCSSTGQSDDGWSCTARADGMSTCTPICGDGHSVGAEVCDDGSTLEGDGCSSSCLVEDGWECHGEPSGCTALPEQLRSTPAIGLPMTGLPPREWSYVEFPETTCGDGSAAALLISPGTEDLVFFMEGGWVCFDYADCAGLLTQPAIGGMPRRALGSVDVGNRPSLLDYFDSSNSWTGTIFARDDPDNAFRDFTFVYDMECTADLYAGDAVVTSAQGLNIHHKGHANIVSFLGRVAATWPEPTRLVVTGSSGGGFGSLINYDTFRQFWPNQKKMYLIDDSGPVLAAAAFPTDGMPVMDGWSLWNVPSALGDICPECHDDFSLIYSALERWYPNDRKSVLSHLDDPTIERGTPPADFAAAMSTTASTALEPSRWKWFYSSPRGHTFIAGLAGATRTADIMTTATSAGVPLHAFLQEQLSDSPSWSSVAPPP